MGRLFNQGRFELFSTTVGVFQGVSSHEILELDGGLGGTTSLLHNTETQNLVGLSVQLDRHSILNVGSIHGNIQGRGWSNGMLANRGKSSGGTGDQKKTDNFAEHDGDDGVAAGLLQMMQGEEKMLSLSRFVGERGCRCLMDETTSHDHPLLAVLRS